MTGASSEASRLSVRAPQVLQRTTDLAQRGFDSTRGQHGFDQVFSRLSRCGHRVQSRAHCLIITLHPAALQQRHLLRFDLVRNPKNESEGVTDLVWQLTPTTFFSPFSSAL